MNVAQIARVVVGIAACTGLMAMASPTTVMFTNGVNGYTGARDKAVYEPARMSDWGGFYFGDSYMLVNEQPG